MKTLVHSTKYTAIFMKIKNEVNMNDKLHNSFIKCILIDVSFFL